VSLPLHPLLFQVLEQTLDQESVYAEHLDPAADVLDEIRLVPCYSSLSQLQRANVVQVYTRLVGVVDGRLVFLVGCADSR
jgi:hypothetical protein